MKTVFSNDGVAKAWASFNTGSGYSFGRSGNGNFFFADRRLYSYGYHFCVGQYFTVANDETVCLINNNGYSVTTARHVSRARNYNTLPSIRVDNPDPRNEAEHNANLVDLLARAFALETKAIRARTYKSQYLADAALLRADAMTYREWFNIKAA